MKMKTFGAVLILSILLCAKAHIQHVDIQFTGCSESDGEEVFGTDGEEERYADFIKQKSVMVLPPFADPITYPGFYEYAVGQQAICKSSLDVAKKVYKNPPLELDAPQSSIYPRDDVELGVENSLICHVTGFHPASVRIRWTRNNLNVSEGVTASVPYLNKDFTYYKFSSLKFTPEEGDIYTCTVEHRALSQPLTRIWDVEVNQPSIGPAVFCGVGLTLGLVGVATGTFFLIKGNECS